MNVDNPMSTKIAHLTKQYYMAPAVQLTVALIIS